MSEASPRTAVNADHLLSLSFAIRGSADENGSSQQSPRSTSTEPTAASVEIVGEEGAVDTMAGVSLDTTPDGACTSPWDTRCTRSEQPIQVFTFLSMSYFWFRVEYAIRIGFVAVLPVALLAYLPETTTKWNIPGVMLTVAFCEQFNISQLSKRRNPPTN